MNEIEIAIEKDISHQYSDAVYHYINSIRDENNLDAYINLAFLYWIFQDYGFFSNNKIPNELRDTGYEEFLNIIKLGLEKFPNDTELNFWEKYFQLILFGEDFSEQDCKNLLERYKSNSLVPYFYLYLFDKEKYKEKIIELIEEINNSSTAKNLYIKSVIGEDFL